MPLLKIKNHRTGETIFEGAFDSAKACIEQAVRENTCLDYADLRYANLANAALDDIVMRHALLDNTNLTGANLSEAKLDGTSFTSATLYGACLCVSSLRSCHFEGASFGASDISGSDVSECRFSTLSALRLNFIDAEKIENCQFTDGSGQTCPFSLPPLYVSGLAMPVVFMDEHLKIGTIVKSYQDWLAQTNDNTPESHLPIGHIYSFFKKHQAMFREMHHGMQLQDKGTEQHATQLAK